MDIKSDIDPEESREQILLYEEGNAENNLPVGLIRDVNSEKLK